MAFVCRKSNFKVRHVWCATTIPCGCSLCIRYNDKAFRSIVKKFVCIVS